MDELHTSLSQCVVEGKVTSWEDLVPLFERALQLSKDAGVRGTLPEHVLVEDIAHVLAAFADDALCHSPPPRPAVHTATLAFRTLRNACVESPPMQNALSSRISLVSTAVRILQTICVDPASLQDGGDGKAADSLLACARSGIQMLGNIVAGNDTAQAALWPHIFPRLLGVLLSTGDSVIFTATTMILYNCIRESEARLDAFAALAPGWDLARRLLLVMEEKLESTSSGNTASHEASGSKAADLNWCFFIIEAVMKAGKLPQLYHGLETPLAEQSLKNPELVTTHIAACQQAKLVLLKVLEGFVLDTKDDDPETHAVLAMDTVKLLGERFRLLGYLAEEREWWGAEESHFPSLTLVMVTSILAKASAKTALEVRTYLGNCGVLEKCIVLLRNTKQWLLEDDLVRRARREASEEASTHASTASSQHRPFSDFPHTKGFARDLMAIVGNLAFEHRENQDLTRQYEGIQAILSHLTIDEHNPFIKEWAVVALKHLCKGNVENQQVLASIEQRPRDVVTSKELDDMGLEIELDPHTGRPRVKQRPRDDAAKAKAANMPKEEDFM